MEHLHCTINVGNYQEAPQNISLNNLLDQIKLDFKHIISQGNLKLLIENLPEVKAHFQPLKIVFSNLVARTYLNTVNKTTVHIYCKKNAENVEVIIEDDAGELSAKEQKIIKQAFKSVDNAKKAYNINPSARFLKEVMLSYKGDINFESISSKGTKFILTFPNHLIVDKY